MGYNNYNSYGTWFIGCLMGIVIMLGWIIFAAWVGAWIWNDIIVTKFNAPSLTYVDMLLIMILARLVFPININYNNKK